MAGVVFDMDGTLVDSLPVALECYRPVVLEFDGPERSHDETLGSFSVGPAHWGRRHDPAREVDLVAESPDDLVSLLLPRTLVPAEP